MLAKHAERARSTGKKEDQLSQDRGLANILTVLLAVVVLSQEKLSVVMG